MANGNILYFTKLIMLFKQQIMKLFDISNLSDNYINICFMIKMTVDD